MNYQEELNENQYKAVTSEAQFLRIIAGAGSGKTRVLTYRIAYLIEKREVAPYNILAITFTNKVAKEMKIRTENLIPDYDLRYLTISTFHSFCARFLRSEIGVLGFPSTFLIMDEDDSLSLIKTIGETFGYKRTDEKNKNAYQFISNQKCYGKLPSDIENKYYSHQEDIKYFKEYEKRKNKMFQLDFDDLIIYTIRILKAYPEIQEKWSKRFQHILVDEFQDTNDLQFELLTLLSSPQSNIYVVGDPDQTIYTWRGANQKIIMNFDNYYKPTTTITLNENYRSTPNILDAANKLIAHNIDRFKKDLFTNKPVGKEVILKSFDEQYAEANFIGNKISELKMSDSSINYKDIAVLYRSSYLTLKLENILIRKHIPYRVYGGLKFYSRAEVKDAIAYFKVLMNENDDISFERIINVPTRHIGDKSISLLKNEAYKANLSMINYIKEIHKYDTQLRSTVINSLNDLFEKMNQTRSRLKENLEAYSEVLNDFLNEIGYIEFLEEKEEDVDRLENVKSLIDDVKGYLKMNPTSNFSEYLQNVTLFSAQDDIDNSDSVTLMTAHTAKGLEYNYVFIMGFSEGVFPNQRSIMESPNAIEEERRLAYVACTRAKKQLFITYNSGFSFAVKSNAQPSSFIKEMGLKPQGYVFGQFSPSNQQKIYKYGTQNKNKYDNNAQSYLDIKSSNNKVDWKSGDIAIHEAFGEGNVLSVEDDIIKVDFKDFGVKKLLGTHPKLKKK